MILQPQHDFKVIIVGGSISGLTLAHALQRAGISHIVLEKGQNITFGGGASISLQPNGLRILDQLGLYQDISKTTVPMSQSTWRSSDGKVVRKSKFMQMVEERHGYPILCFERSELLDILYGRYESKENVFTNCEVVGVESGRKGVAVMTRDGRVFQGDILIGADGINSVVRQHLWNVDRKSNPEVVRRAEASLESEWFCAFGVSTHDFSDPALFPGAIQILYNNHRCNTVFSSTCNRTFWFLIQKHDKPYRYPNIPRYTSNEARGIMERVVDDMHVTESTSMRDLWGKRTKFAMASLEEVVFDKWWEGRVCLLGDSAHKMTPNAGQGGNAAIESVAVLANLLFDAKAGKRCSLDYDGICEIFKEYQDLRTKRVMTVAESSAALTRIQALDSPFWRFMAKLLPVLGENWETNSTSELMCKSEALNFVEYKGTNGTIPWSGWDLEEYIGHHPENMSLLFVRYVRYLVISGIAWSIVRHLWLTLVYRIAPSFTTLGSFLIYRGFRGIGNSAFGFDQPTAPHVVQHAPTWATFAAGMNMVPIAVIIAVEGFRAKNPRAIIRRQWMILSTALAMQLEGYFSLALLYLAVRNTPPTSSSQDPKGYIVPLKYAKSLRLALFHTIGVLVLLEFGKACGLALDRSDMSQLFLTWLIRNIPILLLIFVFIIGNTKHRSSSKTLFGHEDMPHIVGTLQLSAVLSALTHICSIVLWTTGFAEDPVGHRSRTVKFTELFLGGHGLNKDMRDQYWPFVAVSLIWCLWNTINIRHPQERTLWLVVRLILQMLVGCIFAGPGATMSVFWIGREDGTRCLDSCLTSS